MSRTAAYPRGAYITHYKEMGHMRDSMNHCLQKQPSTPHLPLPDYVDSAAVLEEIRAGARLTAAVASRRRPAHPPRRRCRCACTRRS